MVDSLLGYYQTRDSSVTSLELLEFSDASEEAYMGVV